MEEQLHSFFTLGSQIYAASYIRAEPSRTNTPMTGRPINLLVASSFQIHCHILTVVVRFLLVQTLSTGSSIREAEKTYLYKRAAIN